jgi:phosphatidylinositol alpha 1,6-mannosyltransferase
LTPPLRVVLFADSFEEPNGVATVSREFTAFAEQRELAFCCVRAGSKRRVSSQGSVTTIELDRGPASFSLDKDLRCDPLLSRHRNWVIDRLKDFRPDLIHITGPGDFGVLGFWVSNVLGIPLAASWHTNLHEYASKRIQRKLAFLPPGARGRIGAITEELSLDALIRFYRLPHFVLAPNREMVDELSRRTTRPAYFMAHGVDTGRFSPALRKRVNGPISIGYVGRLTPEKNLRWFRELEQRLAAAGQPGFRLVLVGDGSEREWLTRNLQFAELPGVLRGDKLAAAFADMDIFVFPSRTDTFGLVILEAMASGVPVIVTPQTGERVHVRNGVDGFLTEDFTERVLHLMRNETLRQGMGAEARRTACSRSWCSVFEELYLIYETALEREDVRRRIKNPTRAGQPAERLCPK